MAESVNSFSAVPVIEYLPALLCTKAVQWGQEGRWRPLQHQEVYVCHTFYTVMQTFRYNNKEVHGTGMDISNLLLL
jgi:hypothetical protein